MGGSYSSSGSGKKETGNGQEPLSGGYSNVGTQGTKAQGRELKMLPDLGPKGPGVWVAPQEDREGRGKLQGEPAG